MPEADQTGREDARDSGEAERTETPEHGEGGSQGGGRRRVIFALAALVLVGALFGGTWWYLHRDQESTDDAFVDGNVIHIGPQVTGPVVALHFTDNQLVRAGDLLVEIDPRDYQAALASAEADLAAALAQQQAAAADLELTKATTAATIAEAGAGLAAARHAVDQARAQTDAAAAEAERAKGDVARAEDLFKRKVASAQQLDNARAAARSGEAERQAAERAVATARAEVKEAEARLEEAHTAPQQVALKEAQVAAARAQVDRAAAAVRTAKLDLSYTLIRAPADGRVTRRAVNVGDLVQRAQTLTDLVSGAPWVTANFKETQLTRMRPGQPVEIAVDAYPDQGFAGHVESIQAGTGARFSLLPPENATGNFVKVVQRVPVKITFDEPEQIERFLALGMSVVPTVDVGAAPQAQADGSAGASGTAPEAAGATR